MVQCAPVCECSVGEHNSNFTKTSGRYIPRVNEAINQLTTGGHHIEREKEREKKHGDRTVSLICDQSRGFESSPQGPWVCGKNPSDTVHTLETWKKRNLCIVLMKLQYTSSSHHQPLTSCKSISHPPDTEFVREMPQKKHICGVLSNFGRQSASGE